MQIVGRLSFQGHARTVSHEIIYRYIYRPQGKCGQLHRCLWEARPGADIAPPDRRRGSCIPNRCSIHERPALINDRGEFGHWEGDSMDFRYQKRPLLTLTERRTRFALAPKRLDRTADSAIAEQKRLLARLLSVARRPTVYEDGSESAGHQDVATATGMVTYFCDLHAPWQRGAIENVNRGLRRDLPRKAPMDN